MTAAPTARAAEQVAAERQCRFDPQHRGGCLTEGERAVLALRDDDAASEKLPDDTAPVLIAQIGAETVRAEAVVALLGDALGLRPAQEVDQVAGAERLDPAVREAFKLKFNQDIYEGYGATETAPVASVNLPDALDVSYLQVQRGGKLGTVGMPLPGTGLKIVDPQTFAELPTGEAGMVLIGGPQLMQGYLNDPERTAKAIREIDGERWYVTGDQGRLDEDGFLTIVDRYSRFAKIGGEMVSLGAVEQALAKAVADPEIELLAVNLPDARKGERIVVLHTGELDGAAIEKTLLAQGVGGLLLPSVWLAADSLPKLCTGKADVAVAERPYILYRAM